MEVNKILTDVPIIDELVYYTKIMALDTIIKDSDEAGNYETLESITKSDLYIQCINGRATFLMMDNYTLDMMVQVDLQPVDIREKCVEDKKLVPNVYREPLRKLAVDAYVSDYQNNNREMNEYYRMLNGIPAYTDKSVLPLTINQSWEPGIYIKDYDNLPDDIDLTIPLHEYDKSIIELLRELGVIDKVREDYPTKKYLNYLGNRKVSIYDSRTAEDFGILYVPQVEITELYQRYKDNLEKNRVYVMKVIYNEAFKLESSYYNKFIIILILIQSFVDMIISAPEYLIRKEVFDIRTVQYIFEAYNIDYFKEIPLKYQTAMVKNLNKLIKFKSTTKNMVDICKLFGFEDINVFKYYLLRNRITDEEGNFVYNYKEIDDPDNPGQKITVEDVDKNYELEFFKMPIDGDMETYVRDVMSFISYDDITRQDKYWDGDRTHAEVKSDILNREFNILQSKYISIDSVYHLTNLSFERPYFFSILFEEDRRTDGVKMAVPYITTTKQFRFTDIICFLYSLMYEYYGIQDSLLDTTTAIMSVKGFNFKADMAALSKYLMDNKTSLKECGIDTFKIPTGTILTFGQIVDIFTNNAAIYDHIESELYNAKDYKTYRIYKTIYESLMIHDENMKFFRKSNGDIAVSYFDFLTDRDQVLTDAITEIRNISTPDDKTAALINMVNYTILSISEYLDTDKYKHLFSDMPTESATAIQKYIYKVINFFKSYKIDILSINNIYKLDDESNKVLIVDNQILDATFDKKDTITVNQKVYKTSGYFSGNDNMPYTDTLQKAATILDKDSVTIIDGIIKDTAVDYTDISILNDIFKPISTLESSDKGLDIFDKIWIEITNTPLTGWITSSDMNTARSALAGAGTQTSALSFGGYTSVYVVNTEKFNTGVWSNSGELNVQRGYLGGCGLQDAALSFGGLAPAINPVTEKFNGTSWVWNAEANLNKQRYGIGSAGLQDAALAFGGESAGSGTNKETEKFNGTVWSNTGSLNNAGNSMAGCGTQTSALCCGGITNNAVTLLTATELFDGSIWSIGADINTPRRGLACSGLQNAALSFGGTGSFGGAFTTAEKFNGSVWSSVNNMNVGRGYVAGCGLQNSALSFGGHSSSSIGLASTERYMG